MAVLAKIRKRSGLLIGAIAFALLAFIIQDLIQKGRFNQASKDVGSVNGKDIVFDDFRVKVANLEKNNQGGGQNTSTMQAVEQIWNQETSVALINSQFDKAGIRVSDANISSVFEKDPQIGQNPQFQNKSGKFDLNKFYDFFQSSPEQLEYLNSRKKDATINSKYQIYSSLVKGGMFTTNAEGKFKYELENNKANFNFVAVPYSSIKDADVKVTDADITEYMKKHEKQYKSDGTREIEYVLIEDKPSPADETEIKKRVDVYLNGGIEANSATGNNDTIPAFKNATNVAEYLGIYSEKPYDSTYVTKQEMPAEFADKLMSLQPGEVFGPYVSNKYYNITKSMGRKAGAKAKASHILISWEGTKLPTKKEKRTKEQALAKAQSLLAQAQANPQSFMMLAFANSDDSSAQQGGDLGYFAQSQMVKPFNDFVFNNPVGKIGLVETEFGYHIINVTDKQDAVRLATLALKMEPSENTVNELYTKATKFEKDASENKDFAAVAKKAGLTVNPAVKAKPMDEVFGTAGNQRQIIKWAYSDDTKVGDVKRFEVVNVGNVIARLKKVNEKGLMTVEDAKPMVETIIRNQKKAEKIIAKMKGSTLEAIAKANNVTVQNAPSASVENAVLGAVGNEPKVVGTAIGLGANKVSAPIEGNSGVYVVKAVSVAKSPNLKDYTEYVNKVKGNAAQGANRVIPALKNNADIEDNRLEFY